MTDHPPETSRLAFSFWEHRSPVDVTRAAAALALSLLFFRLLVLLVLPLDLSGDEAYYWEWGRHPAPGYFSKPPGIAWWMALAGAVGGDTTFGVRMFAVFLGTGTFWLFYLLTRTLYGSGVAMIAAIAFVANPANAALNLVLTIDAPLMFFWTLSLVAFWHFVQPAANRPAWGALLTVGLAGGYLSKQMMLVFPVLAVLFLASSSKHRSELRRAGFWACLVLSLTALIPPLVWNIQNEWVTVTHTMHHFESGSPTPGKRIARFFEFVGSQLGLITPVLWTLMLVVAGAGLVAWKRLGDRERFLWLFSAPAILVMLAMAFRQRINPNWPAVFYVAATALVAGWASGKGSLHPGIDRWRRSFRPGLKLGIGMAAAVYLVVSLLSFGLVSINSLDPSARLRGWSTIARNVEQARNELAPELMIITQGHRYLTSELAFYLPDQPRIYPYNPNPEVIAVQHDLWENPSSRLGEDALIVVQGDASQLTEGLADRFEATRLIRTLVHPDLRHDQRTITLFFGQTLKRWPSFRRPDSGPNEDRP